MTLNAWLQERAREWSAPTLLHRACIVDRFLDFLVQEGSIGSNPLAELRAKYCISGGETILRALTPSEPNRRRWKPCAGCLRFGSVLGRCYAPSC